MIATCIGDKGQRNHPKKLYCESRNSNVNKFEDPETREKRPLGQRLDFR